jgi:STE24 endopeptidase
MEENLKQSKQYSKLKVGISIIQFILTIAFFLIMLIARASIFLADAVKSRFENFYLQVGLYLIIFGCIYYLVFLPLNFYEGFLLEHKFHLSNQTLAGWAIRSLKKLLISLPILLLAAEALYPALRYFGDYWWLPVTAAWLFMTVVLSKIAPILIIPLLYKCRPLADGGLKKKLLELGERCGVRIKDVFEIKLSKETKKANAAVAGFGKGRRILLGDTLMKDYTADEIEAVFAHELGHVRLLHTWKILGFGTIVSAACFYLTSLLFGRSINILGFENIYDIAAFPLLLLFLLLVGFALVPIQNGYTRHLEKQADMFALDRTADSRNLASALSKLSIQNLSDPSPGRLVKLFFYDHPPVAERLAYCNQKIGRQVYPETQ